MINIAYIRSKNIYDDSRATKEIISLASAGYNITVFGWNRSGDAIKKCQDVFSRYKNIEFCFYDALVEANIGFKNLPKLVLWLLWIRRQLSKKIFAVVHACDLDTVLGVVSYCRKNNVPLVYDIYDFYIDSHNVPSFLKKFIEYKEIEAINLSKATIICTEQRRLQIASASPQKIVVIHNSPDVDSVSHTENLYHYVYCGGLNEGRLLKEILSKYDSNADLKMFFAGNGIYYNKVCMIANEYNNFSCKGTIPYSEVLDTENKAVCLAAIYEPTIRNHRLCAPNKFYEALALGKPVIVCKGTGIDELVKKHCLGVVIDYDVTAFYHAVRFLSENPKLCEDMGRRGRALYEREFKWSIMNDRLLELYEEILRR